jgi:hypothetical protein
VIGRTDGSRFKARGESRLEIVIRCTKCAAGLPVTPSDSSASIACGRCGQAAALAFSPAIREDRAVDVCPLCGGGDFYLRKDFDPKLGLTVVIIGALVSAGFYWFGHDLMAYSILGGAALIDLIVYGRLKDVTVCYRCHAEFRGSYMRSAAAFDLHTADELELEFARRIGKR